MSEFLHLRFYGLCQIVDGLVTLLSPWRPRLALRTAKRLARKRGLAQIAAAARSESETT